jgi:type IV secretion system protein VirB6
MSGCDGAIDAGVVRAVLGVIDCNTRGFAERGYGALTTAGSPFQLALTILLTLYVAFVGYRLIFAPDGARLSEAPRMALKIGAVLALLTSWSVFSTLVFDVADRAPLEIARLISAPGHNGLSREADPVGRLQVAYDQISLEAVRFDKAAGPATAANAGREAAAARALAGAGGTLLLANAGLIAGGELAISVLTAVGPVFIALFLLTATRGLFVGWARSLIAAAMISFSAWVLAILMLNVLDPWLVALALDRHENHLEPQTAITASAIVVVFAVGQLAMVFAAAVVALSLRLPGARGAERSARVAVIPPESRLSPAEQVSRVDRLAEQLRRGDPRVSRADQIARAVAGGAAAARDARSLARRPDERGGLYRRPAILNRRQDAPA